MSTRGSPEATALVAGRSRLSYGELGARVAAAASELERRGVDEGDRVALVARSEASTVAALLGVVERGATVVPIHPRLTPAERARLGRAIAPALFLGEDDVRSLAERPSERAPQRSRPAASAPFAIVFTSGTSGAPKGAVLSRSAFAASSEASARVLPLGAPDVWIACMPLAHVGGLSILTRCFRTGASVVLEPRFDADAVLSAVARESATLLSVVPTMLHDLLLRDRDGVLSRLRAVLVGGAAASPALLAECAHRGVLALTTYGLTEACSQVTLQRPRDPRTREPGSGPVLPGLSVVVRDEAGTPLEAAMEGLIAVRGPTLLDGYWGHRTSPFDREGWFETGDVGALDAEGRLHVAARRSDLIVTGGENVAPVEVEQALERLPGVRGALVFGLPDERWGQVVAALLEVERDRFRQDAFATLAAFLAPHKLPRWASVVETLPILPNGKLDRKGAAERFRARLRPVVAKAITG